jgi:hypothetical protein
MILSIDPGDSTGLARFYMDGSLVDKFKLPYENAIEYLSHVNGVSAIVIEDFRLRRGKAMQQSGSKFPAVQVIGAAKLYCRIHDTGFFAQSPQILKIAALHSNTHIPLKGHIDDDVSAFLHGWYWFESKGILKPVSLV